MRYLNQPNIPFYLNFRTVLLKETLPLAPITLSNVIAEVNEYSALDQIASERKYYGQGMEYLAYQIFDENIEELFDCGFDLAKLRQLRIP